MKADVEFVNLREFLADLARARSEIEHELPERLRAAVTDVALPYAVSRVPRRSGRLAGSGRVERRGDDVGVVFDAPYGRGAEAGNFGKWSGFRRYGAPGHRFGGAAMDATDDAVAERVVAHMLPQFAVFGWFR